MTIIGYRLIGDKLVEIMRIDGKNADERAKIYLESLGLPVEESYMEEHVKSNFYTIFIKIHEDGTQELIDLAYHARKGSYHGRPFPPKRNKRSQEKRKRKPRKKDNTIKKNEKKEKTAGDQKKIDLSPLVRPEGVTVQEIMLEGRKPALSKLIVELEDRYSEAWEKEPLVYADGYIKFLISLGDYYLQRYKEATGDDSPEEAAKPQRYLDSFDAWLVALKEGSLFANKAINYYQQAAQVATQVAFIYFPQGDNPEEAEKYLKMAADLAEKMISLGESGENLWTYFSNLGTHYYETYRSGDALPVLEKALRYATSPDARIVVFHNLSLCHADLGNVSKAVEYLARSICLHYAINNEYSDVKYYNADIERVSSMVGDDFTDLLALRIALDFVGGGLTKDEACRYLKEIPKEKWPLSRTLQQLICGGVPLQEVPYRCEECKALLEDVERVINLQ